MLKVTSLIQIARDRDQYEDKVSTLRKSVRVPKGIYEIISKKKQGLRPYYDVTIMPVRFMYVL